MQVSNRQFRLLPKREKELKTRLPQLYDQFMKESCERYRQSVGKINALTILQYINYKMQGPLAKLTISYLLDFRKNIFHTGLFTVPLGRIYLSVDQKYITHE